MKHKGWVFWITGLSGSGKSTISSLLRDELSKLGKSFIILDGDDLREIFGNDLGYSRDDRLKSAYRNVRIARFLSDQGVNIIVTTISMFHEIRDWNRKNITNYFEIFLDVPMDVLKARDVKGIYKKRLETQIGQIAGLDFEIEFPNNPDVTIYTHQDSGPSESVKKILNSIKKVL